MYLGDQYINLDNVTRIEVVREDKIVVYFLGYVGVDDYGSPTNKLTYIGWAAQEILAKLSAELQRVTDPGEETE
jgi:hypothetical protein